MRVEYAVSPSVQYIKLQSDGQTIKNPKAENMNVKNVYYGYVDVTQSESEEIEWKFVDQAGRDSECKTIFKEVTVKATGDPCEDAGCPDAFIDDGWCDAPCLIEACGYDSKDCKEEEALTALDCNFYSIGDGICNPECDNQIGFFDGGDCKNACARTGCNTSKLGDGLCDPSCFNEACDYDRTDCNACSAGCTVDDLKGGICKTECNTKECAYSMGNCGTKECESHGCSMSMVGDMKCDIVCNNEDCLFDGGDCAICANHGCTNDKLSNGKCDPDCYYAECQWDRYQCFSESNIDDQEDEIEQDDWDEDDTYDYDDSLCKEMTACDGEDDVSDGDCDPECYNSYCRWDGGDCADILCSPGCFKQLIGDGFCDPDCQVAACQFDGDDCTKNVCSAQCLDEQKGDNICDPTCNNQACNYDDGDCANLTGITLDRGTFTKGNTVYVASTTCERELALWISITAYFLLL